MASSALDKTVAPHLGFPLSPRLGRRRHPGPATGNHARFDLASGGTFDLWADDVPTAAVEAGGMTGPVWVCRRTRYADGDDHWRNRRREGRAAQYRPRPRQSRARPSVVTKRIIERWFAMPCCSVSVHRDGWGVGQTIGHRASANLIPSPAGGGDLISPSSHGLRRVAEAIADGGSAAARTAPVTGGFAARARCLCSVAWLRHWTQVRHRDGARAHLAGRPSPAAPRLPSSPPCC